MTDRELLELAAKAAGWFWTDYDERAGLVACLNPDEGCGWNPLTDDGDALRLAVKLGMSLDTALGHSLAIASVGKDCVVRHDANPYAATRRAIVRAAAEMGRSASGKPMLDAEKFARQWNPDWERESSIGIPPY